MYMTPEEIRQKFPDVPIGSGTWIGSGVRMSNDVAIGSDARIGRGVRIERGVRIGSDVAIGSGGQIGSRTRIKSHVIIGRDVLIGSDVLIRSNVGIENGARIGSGARIGVSRKGVTRTLVINGIGKTKQMTAHTSEDGLVIVIGCLNGHRGATIEQARKAIAEEYSADHAYFVALELAQRWYDQLEYTNTN